MFPFIFTSSQRKKSTGFGDPLSFLCPKWGLTKNLCLWIDFHKMWYTHRCPPLEKLILVICLFFQMPSSGPKFTLIAHFSALACLLESIATVHVSSLNYIKTRIACSITNQVCCVWPQPSGCTHTSASPSVFSTTPLVGSETCFSFSSSIFLLLRSPGAPLSHFYAWLHSTNSGQASALRLKSTRVQTGTSVQGNTSQHQNSGQIKPHQQETLLTPQLSNTINKKGLLPFSFWLYKMNFNKSLFMLVLCNLKKKVLRMHWGSMWCHFPSSSKTRVCIIIERYAEELQDSSVLDWNILISYHTLHLHIKSLQLNATRSGLYSRVVQNGLGKWKWIVRDGNNKEEIRSTPRVSQISMTEYLRLVVFTWEVRFVRQDCAELDDYISSQPHLQGVKLLAFANWGVTL